MLTSIRAVAQGLERIADQCEVSAQRVLEEMQRLAFANVQDFYHKDGTLKAMHELRREHGSALEHVEVVLKHVTVSDEHVDRVYRIRLHDKLKALEMLAKHFALLTDHVEHAVRTELIKMLEDGVGGMPRLRRTLRSSVHPMSRGSVRRDYNATTKHFHI